MKQPLLSSPTPKRRLSDPLCVAMNQAARQRRLWLLDAIGKDATRALVEVKQRRLEDEHPNLCETLSKTDRFELALLLAFLEVKTGRLWK